MKRKKKLTKKVNQKVKSFWLLKIVISLALFFTAGYTLYMYVLPSFSKKEERKVGVRHDTVMSLPETKLDVEIVSTKEEVEQGLSGRISMQEKEGMFFVFPSMGEYSFWMKDMNFPLDLVWISDEGRVVSISSDVATSTYPKKIFKNDAYAKYVLEMNAGTARKFGLFLGTSVGLPSGLAK